MTRLQRSVTSFRRQGSSGTVWDDKFLNELSDQLNQKADEENKPLEEENPAIAVGSTSTIRRSRSMITTIERSRSISTVQRSKSNGCIERSRSNGSVERSRSSGGGRALTTRRVLVLSPALDPPSPRVSACGFCGFSCKKENRRRPKSGKRRV